MSSGNVWEAWYKDANFLTFLLYFSLLQILLTVGILAVVMPLFWLGKGGKAVDLWLWLPLLHLFSGGTWAAIDLCSNNIQMSSMTSAKSQAVYFAIASAMAGVTDALGTATEGFLAQFVYAVYWDFFPPLLFYE
ncbi:hypothetical protein AVDCRST_MAG92-4086 [uncultured Coleofasciculus sp.]|uniref:Uncharacterized protein n=1 Tax=uncultured Coleofasciculus sp. TaxID=1267456 RepID=A0A6J4JUX9_9CYAN|nr:hypothetical protein AVDCRST_MAG92-4086 [uncultured Coleofasciculus sp.]